ncbi:hypothetical protein MKX03_016195, partial [Papaver bracteatum]
SSNTNGEYALKNSRTNLFKEREDDALWMLPTKIKIPFLSHFYSIAKIQNMSLVVLYIRRDKVRGGSFCFRIFCEDESFLFFRP